MSEKNWQKQEQINPLRNQINDSLDNLMNENMLKTKNTTWEPAIEIKETDLNVIVQAQVPGIEPNNLDIHVTQNTIFIAGEYGEQKVYNEKLIYHSEFNYGHFQRKVTLPIRVDYKQVTAEIHNGLLTLNLPKIYALKFGGIIQEREREILVKQRQNQ